MRTTILACVVFLLLFSLSAGPPAAAQKDDLAGIWAFSFYDLDDGGRKPLSGIWWNQEGQFVHYVMHRGQPLQEQIAECHFGRYRVESPGKMTVDVEKGVVVNSPRSDEILSPRDSGSFQIPYSRSAEKLKIAHENLVLVTSSRMEIISLDQGKLALSDEHFLLVAKPDSGWMCGSGRYRKEGDRFYLRDWSGFQAEGDEVPYSVDQSLEATFDGKRLQLPGGVGFRVVP